MAVEWIGIRRRGLEGSAIGSSREGRPGHGQPAAVLKAGSDAADSGGMSAFKNARLSRRLGAAFGLLVVALAVVAGVAFTQLDALDERVHTLTERDAAALSKVGDLGTRIQGTAHDSAEHLYVYDGNLEEQDRIQAQQRESVEEIAADSKSSRSAWTPRGPRRPSRPSPPPASRTSTPPRGR